MAKASGADVRVNAMVRELTRTATGWRLTIGSAADPEYLDADAVILATPAAPGRPAAEGGRGRGGGRSSPRIPYASMAIITLAFRAGDFPGPAAQRLPGPGGGRPGGQGRHLLHRQVAAPGPGGRSGDPVHIVRCSVGRSGDVAVLQRDDDDLAALAAAELAESIGLTAPPVAHRVTRWGGGLPQYNVGHLDRVARIRAAVAEQPGLAVAGAAYDGVGIPACIATARQAADQVARPPESHITGPGGATGRSTSLGF